MLNNLKIALVSAADPFDRRTWSGSSYFIMQAFKHYCGSVDYLGKLKIPNLAVKNRLAEIVRKVTGKRTYPERTLKASRYFGKQVSSRLIHEKYDLIVAPAASVEIAHLNTKVPIIYISDATFSLVNNAYPIFSSLSNKTVASEMELERKAMERASLIIYASDWAAESAQKDFQIKSRKIRVIPFGANLDKVPSRVTLATKRNINGRLNILFLGKEWERKGGPVAIDTVEALQAMGINAHLTICGVRPSNGFKHNHVTVVPYLNKNIKGQAEQLHYIIYNSHLLLVPTTTECYGIVFCEANAFGLPVFSKDVGGIPTIIKNGENGYLLPVGATGKDFAKSISNVIQSENHYECLRQKSREMYEKCLNWDTWGMKARQAIYDVIGI